MQREESTIYVNKRPQKSTSVHINDRNKTHKSRWRSQSYINVHVHDITMVLISKMVDCFLEKNNNKTKQNRWRWASRALYTSELIRKPQQHVLNRKTKAKQKPLSIAHLSIMTPDLIPRRSFLKSCMFKLLPKYELIQERHFFTLVSPFSSFYLLLDCNLNPRNGRYFKCRKISNLSVSSWMCWRSLTLTFWICLLLHFLF